MTRAVGPAASTAAAAVAVTAVLVLAGCTSPEPMPTPTSRPASTATSTPTPTAPPPPEPVFDGTASENQAYFDLLNIELIDAGEPPAGARSSTTSSRTATRASTWR